MSTTDITCLFMLHNYIVILRNRFFLNNSGNPEPISMKLYIVMGTQTRRFSGNLGRPQSRAAKVAQNKKTNLFVMEICDISDYFSAVDLREIWTQHMNRCHQSFQIRKRIAKIFPKGSFTP